MPLPNGIYFNMPFEMYLAEERISSSSISDAMEGPSAWWNNSWLNPDRPEDEDSMAKLLGRAYHCARLEPEKFDTLYCRELVQEDFSELPLLTSGTQIGMMLATLGETKKMTGETVMDQAHRLHAHPDFNGYIWQIELARWEVEDKGHREAIPPKHYDEITRAMKQFRLNPEIQDFYSKGAAEVSIFWTDEETGLDLKCRPDWLRPDHVNHLKTWDMRTRGKPGNRAIAERFGYDHLWTAWFYLMGLEWLRTSADVKCAWFDGVEFKEGRDQDGILKLVGAIRKRDTPLETYFTYVRRGMPDIRVRRIRWWSVPPGVEEQSIGAGTDGFRQTLTSLGRKAHDEVNAALKLIHQGMELYGPSDPWFPRDMIDEITDDDFSQYFLEGRSVPR